MTRMQLAEHQMQLPPPAEAAMQPPCQRTSAPPSRRRALETPRGPCARAKAAESSRGFWRRAHTLQQELGESSSWAKPCLPRGRTQCSIQA